MKADVKAFHVMSLNETNAVLGCSSNGISYTGKVENDLLDKAAENRRVSRRRSVRLPIAGLLLVVARRFAQGIDHGHNGRTRLRLILKAG